MRWLFATLAKVVLALVAVGVVALGYRTWRQHENADAFAITTPRGIQEARYVSIGGIEQWIQIRGEDRDNPILLILAGGPGNSLVPLTPVFRTWERQFTVVQWDQRGSGKTYGRNPNDAASMTIERLTRDGIEVTHYLLDHLQKHKLVLVGHSWGTVLGVLMVKQEPQLYSAYVGTGQVVAKEEKEEILYARVMANARAANDSDGVRRLEAIGAPPYASQRELLVERDVSERYDTDAEQNLEAKLRPVVLFAPEFSLYDVYSMLQGAKFAAATMYPEIVGYDARRLGYRFDVPFFIFNGDRDLVTPVDLAQPYFDMIDAPQKALVVLPGGGHSAMLTMPDAFLTELVTRVRPLAN
jgi:pimeloyl-ACP methyl ester carboxylesterase